MKQEAFFHLTYGLYVVGSSLHGRQNGYLSHTVFQMCADRPWRL